MEFDYNFNNCVICSSKMIFSHKPYYYIKCPNGCCSYAVDPHEKIVHVVIFDDRKFAIRLHENSHVDDNVLDLYLRKFLEVVAYWKKDYRYLAEILTR